MQKKEHMRKLVALWEASELNQRDFARQYEISVDCFKYWLYKLRREDKTPKDFIRLDTVGAHQGINLRYPNGVELSVPANTPASVLIELIRSAG